MSRPPIPASLGAEQHERRARRVGTTMTTTRYGLTVPAMLDRAEQGFAEREIVSRTPAGMFRYTYRELAHRVGKLASALVASGVRKGDRVATLAWNHHRYLEGCFAVSA